MKERIICFGGRPLAAVPATDLNMVRHGDMIDESIALKLGFVIRDLQYVWINLAAKKRTRVTGRIKATVQSIEHGRPKDSISLSARVVRDLFSLTGSEVIAGEIFIQKLDNFRKREKESTTSDNPVTGTAISSTANQEAKFPEDSSKYDYESSDRSSERDCSDCTAYSTCSSEQEGEPHNHRMRCAPHYEAHSSRVYERNKKLPSMDAIIPKVMVSKSTNNPHVQEKYSDDVPAWYLRPDPKLQATLAYCGGPSIYCDDEDSSFHEDSDTASERNCSDCMECSDDTSADDTQPRKSWIRCALHGEAHAKASTHKANIRRVRGRNNKLLREASSKVTDEEVEAERIRRVKFQMKPDDVLNQYFPGGSKLAHQFSDRWANEKKEEEAKKRQEEMRLRRVKELPKKIKKKKKR